LLSTLHKTGKINTDTGKPEIIMFYNKTKGGTDTFDQLCKEYTTRITNRWPMRFFFGMLDQAGINAFILYYLGKNNAIIHRREFIKELTFDLVQPCLKKRLEVSSLRKNIKLCIQEILGQEEEIFLNPQTKMRKRKRCSVCSRNNDAKTWFCCALCGSAVCDKHRTNFCLQCAEKNVYS